jgi:hypothetical protein
MIQTQRNNKQQSTRCAQCQFNCAQRNVRSVVAVTDTLKHTTRYFASFKVMYLVYQECFGMAKISVYNLYRAAHQHLRIAHYLIEPAQLPIYDERIEYVTLPKHLTCIRKKVLLSDAVQNKCKRLDEAQEYEKRKQLSAVRQRSNNSNY